MNYRRHIDISITRSTRFNMGNQSRGILITALGQMHFVPGPPHGDLAPICRFNIIWGADHGCWWRDILIRTEVRLPFDLFKLLDPDATECFYRLEMM